MRSKAKATARVRVTVDVALGREWSSAESVAHVLEHAREMALAEIEKAIAHRPGLRVVGSPTVTAFIEDGN